MASSYNTEVTDELDGILTKALEKDPDLSYQTASDLRADLKRVKREIDSSPSLKNTSRSIKIEETARRKNRAMWAGGLIMLCLIGLGVWFFVLKNKNEKIIMNRLIISHFTVVLLLSYSLFANCYTKLMVKNYTPSTILSYLINFPTNFFKFNIFMIFLQ